jgi:hypothetical protein
MLRHLEHEADLVVEHLQRGEDGREPSSKRTSTTAPMTWHTCPMAPAPMNSSVILPPPVFPVAGGGVEGAAWAATNEA